MDVEAVREAASDLALEYTSQLFVFAEDGSEGFDVYEVYKISRNDSEAEVLKYGKWRTGKKNITKKIFLNGIFGIFRRRFEGGRGSHLEQEGESQGETFQVRPKKYVKKMWYFLKK